MATHPRAHSFPSCRHPSLANLFSQSLGPGCYKPHLRPPESMMCGPGKLPIFTEKDLETQEGEVMCSRSHK